MDNSFSDGNNMFHVQTVDTNMAGQMTTAEHNAALDPAKASQQIVVCVAKQTCG